MLIEGSQPLRDDLDRSLVGVGLPGCGWERSRIPGSIRAGWLMGTAGATGETVPPAVWRNTRRSSAMSLAVVYRSVARFDIAFRQMRSSSLGIVSSIWRGGRASVVAIRSSNSLRASSLS